MPQSGKVKWENAAPKGQICDHFWVISAYAKKFRDLSDWIYCSLHLFILWRGKKKNTHPCLSANFFSSNSFAFGFFVVKFATKHDFQTVLRIWSSFECLFFFLVVPWKTFCTFSETFKKSWELQHVHCLFGEVITVATLALSCWVMTITQTQAGEGPERTWRGNGKFGFPRCGASWLNI